MTEAIDELPPPPRRGRHLVLLAACSLAVITYIHRVGFASASSALRGELGLTESQVGSMMAAFMIAYGIWEVPWGLLGDRSGPRRLLPVVILGGSAVTAMVATVTLLPAAGLLPFVYLLVLRFLLGTFQAGTFPTIGRMLADWMPTAERGTAQGALWMSARLGGALAPLLIVPLIQEFGSFRMPLVIVSGLGVLWAVVFSTFYRDAGASKGGPSHAGTPWGLLLRSRSVWALCLMYGCLGYGGNFFITLMPDYLKAQRGLGPDTIKWLTTLPFACGVCACLVGGTLSDILIRVTGSREWNRRLVGLTGMGLAGVAMALVPMAEDVYVLGGLLCLTFFCNDLAMAPAWAAVADHGTKVSGTLGGLMNMTASFTGALGAIVTSRFLEAGQLGYPFWIFGIVYFLGVACWLRVETSRTLVGESKPGA